MVEAAKKEEPKQETKAEEKPAVPLENTYQVWAMVKQQRNNQAQNQAPDMSEVYITDNKVVAKFSTVSFWG